MLQYPRFHSEFEIQAFVFNSLGKMGYDVRGEVPAIIRGARFDLVVFVDKQPKIVIEVKRLVCAKTQIMRGAGSQVARYRLVMQYQRFDIPIALICGMEEASHFIETADNFGLYSNEIERFIPGRDAFSESQIPEFL